MLPEHDPISFNILSDTETLLYRRILYATRTRSDTGTFRNSALLHDYAHDYVPRHDGGGVTH